MAIRGVNIMSLSSRQHPDPYSSAESTPPNPLRVATMMRDLQRALDGTAHERIALEVDETIHIDVAELLLSWVLERLLDAALLAAREDSRIVFGCRSEDDGVVIEVEYDASADPSIAWYAALTSSDLSVLEVAIAAIPATLQVAEGDNACLLYLTLPVELRRTHAPPPPASGES